MKETGGRHVVRIAADDVGRRVTVRRRTPSGSATDVVGDLREWTDDHLVVRDRDDTDHELARRDLIAGHLVASRPAPPRAATLERVTAAGWPAVETEPLGQWLLRAAGGFTGRANSALALGDPGVPFDEAVRRVRAWYADRDLPARAAVVSPSAEDDAFAVRGWVTSPAVLVQTADVDDVSARLRTEGDGVDVHDAPSAAWLARYTARGEVTETGRRVLTGGATVGFAQAGDEPAAIGRGVVTGEWLGLSAIEVAPTARRRGLGTAVTAALLRWGGAHGATRAYLQVQTDNTEAKALYDALGFRTHHRYRYRTPTAPDS
ncbi:MAG: GNAT family N-acetyltransferase [Streptosporangiales bacterium]|nr:GNAT family N-acetyltransferase [Streptosporangiales bacterium]